MSHFFKGCVLFFAALTFLFPAENAFQLINSGNNSTTLKLSTVPQIESIEGGFSRLAKFGKGHTIETGAPELPYYSTYYQLDPHKSYNFQLMVIDSYEIEDISIMPHQGMEKWEVESVMSINEELYSSYAPVPENNLLVSERSAGRGIEFVSVQVTPYTYYPKYKKLVVLKEVEVVITETGDISSPMMKQSKRSHIFDDFYKDMFINFTKSERDNDYQHPSILYIAGGDWRDNAMVQELLHWRHKQGYIINVVTTSEIGASNGNESTIKSYIQNAYDTWENPPEIVGLIGDTDVIDCFYQSWGTGGWNWYNGSTDSDFGQLDGNDLIPEVFVGRISGQASSTMENVINKTIQYEKAIYQSDEWFTRAALLGDPTESGNSTVFTSQYIENIMINHGMTGVETDYDGWGLTNWLIDQFQDGILYYNYRGIYGDEGTSPSNSFNNGYHTPFATIMTCGTGDFDQGNSQTEAFVKMGSVGNPEGAVAAIGLATTGTHTAYNNILNMGVYDAIYPRKIWYAGAAEAYGDLAMITTYPSDPGNAVSAFTGWTNLIGDPALHLWSGVPNNFVVDGPNEISLGTNTLELYVFTEDGNPSENARVTLLMGEDEIFESNLTDENGYVSLSWDEIVPGEVDITIIKRNHRPYEDVITIGSAGGPAVGIAPINVQMTSGMDNTVIIPVKNYGGLHAENLSIQISSEYDHITFSNSDFHIELIATGETKYIEIPIQVFATAFQFDDAKLQFLIKDEIGNSWQSMVPIFIDGPSLFVDGYSGRAEPGIESTISIGIINEGSKSLLDFSYQIIPNSDRVNLISGYGLVPDIESGQTSNLENITLLPDAQLIHGSTLPLLIELSSLDGGKRTETVNITFGEVRESDPMGPDAYGYYIYDNEDLTYDLAPSYNWIELAEGMGTQLEIYDNGNGNNYANTYTHGSIVFDLPFTFTFYGIDYDQIVVNTNGWISFGDFLMYSFRNYSLPGAGGPSPMVAAFWDDLKTGGGGYVYHYADDDMVIIQWDDLRTYDNNGAYRETFEIILYNKANFPATLTGDSEIKIQYQEFNNTSDGYYPNGGTPIHGCYSTIGIENHLGDTGLEVTFNNVFHPAATRVVNGSAIFITTGRQARVDISFQSVDLSDGKLEIHLENEEPISGFQFEIFGLTIENADGGLAEENGFMISTSPEMVLGFSTDGSVIPPGSGVLTEVYFSDYTGEEICFGVNPAANVISNVNGQFLTTNWGECYLPGQLQGDMNNDGILDILDLVTLANIILSGGFEFIGDMNADGQLNILDLVTLINLILA